MFKYQPSATKRKYAKQNQSHWAFIVQCLPSFVTVALGLNRILQNLIESICHKILEKPEKIKIKEKEAAVRQIKAKQCHE